MSAALIGLKGASSAEVMRPTKAAFYCIGQNIGPWPIYFINEHELVAGRDSKHLDFRLSVLKTGTGQTPYAVISMVCRTHNRFGQVYLRAIAPLHKWGIQRLLSKASQAGRL